MLIRLINIIIYIFLVSGCASNPLGQGKAESDTWLTSSWERFKQSSLKTIKDPQVWVPSLGAVVFAANHLDKDSTDWLSQHHPTSDGNSSADRQSDDLLILSNLELLASVLLISDGDTTGDSTWSKGRAIGVGVLAIGVNDGISDTIKRQVGRPRPDDSSRRSFPSKHTSAASVRATLAARNLNLVPMNTPLRKFLQTTFHMTAALTGWSRVEANRHYPSDVMFGYALGHFIGSVSYDVFINNYENSLFTIRLVPVINGFSLSLDSFF